MKGAAPLKTAGVSLLMEAGKALQRCRNSSSITAGTQCTAASKLGAASAPSACCIYNTSPVSKLQGDVACMLLPVAPALAAYTKRLDIYL